MCPSTSPIHPPIHHISEHITNHISGQVIHRVPHVFCTLILWMFYTTFGFIAHSTNLILFTDYEVWGTYCGQRRRRSEMVVVCGRVGKHAKLPACLVMLHKKFERQVFRYAMYLTFKLLVQHHQTCWQLRMTNHHHLTSLSPSSTVSLPKHLIVSR